MKRLLLLLALTGCATTQAIDLTLLPAAQEAWPSVRADIEMGVTGALELGEITDVEAASIRQEMDTLTTGLAESHFLIAGVDWPTLEGWGVRGIQRRVEIGQISEGVATSLYERLLNFRNTVAILSGRMALSERPAVRPPLGSDWFEAHGYVRDELGVPRTTNYPLTTSEQDDRALALRRQILKDQLNRDIDLVLEALAERGQR